MTSNGEQERGEREAVERHERGREAMSHSVEKGIEA